MFSRVRGFLVALVIGALLVLDAAPAAASASDDVARYHQVPVLMDALVLRPIGLVMLGLGAAVAPVPMAIVGITHPPDILKPFNALVVVPARYTFIDPIGYH
jgi:hypothetical protein